MKALRWYGRKDLRYEDTAEPSPGPGQVKIKINLAGICGSDLKEYTDGPCLIPADKTPLTVGHEFAGRVVELGEGVTDFKVGERVSGVGYRVCGQCFYCKKAIYNLCSNSKFTGAQVDGCMAEYLISPGYSLYKLPDSVSDEAGALVEPLAVAVHAVRQVHPGDKVVIVGDGAIGLCSLLAARAAGASNVYVVAKHKNRGEIASTLGANEVVYLSDGEPVRLIGNLTDGLGADISIECVGNPETPQLAAELARNGGIVVILGVFNKPSSFDFGNIVFGEKTIMGSSIYIDEGRTAVALMADGRIDPSRLITSKVPLQDAVEKGFNELLSNKEKNIKVLLQVP